MIDYCPLKERVCVHCVDDEKRVMCMHRKAKVANDGFPYVASQEMCPIDRANNKRTQEAKKIYDKYKRNRNEF